MDLLLERGTFLVATTYLADGMDVSHAPPELQAKAAEVFPRARRTISRAIERGVRIACGTDAPAIPHGRNAKELIALVRAGHDPVAGPAGSDHGGGRADRASTTGPGWRRGCWPTSSPCPATPWPTSP